MTSAKISRLLDPILSLWSLINFGFEIFFEKIIEEIDSHYYEKENKTVRQIQSLHEIFNLLEKTSEQMKNNK